VTTLSRQVSLAVALQSFAAVVLGGPLLVTGKLVNDRVDNFYFFRDTLHSLNVFGEYPWWNPSIWAGFPGYYITLLYWPGRDPLFGLVELAVWLLGRLQITIESYVPVYVAYFAFLVPLLLTLSVLALARQILRRRLAVYLVIVLMAFSPAVVVSVSDLVTEVTTYGFLFAAALLHFVRRPSPARFALLAFSAMAVATALTYFALFWNVFFVPAFLLLVSVGAGGDRVGRACRGIHPAWRAAAAAGTLVCALPSAVAYSHGGDILSTRAGGNRYYAYEDLRPGTPLEALAVSTPGIGFNWTEYSDPRAVYEPQPIAGETRRYSAFVYMGLLTLPLVCLGLVFGRPYWSIRLFWCIAVVLTVIALSAYSPIFSLLLGWPSPFRGVNHYSDLVVRPGLSPLFALAAGLGFEAALKAPAVRRWVLMGLFGATAALSSAWLISFQSSATSHSHILGLSLAFVVLYAVALARLALARTTADVRTAVVVLLALMFVDTSTMAFNHLRLSTARAAASPIEPGPDTIGSVVGREETEFLYLRGMYDEALLAAPAHPVVLQHLHAAEPVPHEAVSITGRTYNGIEMRVRTSQPARLEWRDAYFPFWRAWVNGAEVAVERTVGGMKGVRVPAGESLVVFRFSPTVLRGLSAAATSIVALTAVLWLFLWRRERPRLVSNAGRGA
jgi:hypothetical protein